MRKGPPPPLPTYTAPALKGCTTIYKERLSQDLQSRLSQLSRLSQVGCQELSRLSQVGCQELSRLLSGDVRLEGHSSSGCSTPARYSDMHCSIKFVNYLSSACPNIELVYSLETFLSHEILTKGCQKIKPAECF